MQLQQARTGVVEMMQVRGRVGARGRARARGRVRTGVVEMMQAELRMAP